MAVIHFTESDYLQTTTVEAGCYPTSITKLEGPQKSKSEKSFHYYVDFTITDGKYKGKTRTVSFNTETKSASLLGDMQFFPTSDFLIVARATGVDDGTKKDFVLDTDLLLNKPMDVDWGVATVEGRLVNTINGFHASGYAKDAPAF